MSDIPESTRLAKDVSLLPVIELRVDSLKSYAFNSKIHDKSQIDRLSKQIAKEGLQESLIVEEDGTLVAGHGRWLSVQKLGWSFVPCRVMKEQDYTQAQIHFTRISSNQTVSHKYDTDLQKQELDALLESLGESDSDHLADSLGYTIRDLDLLMSNDIVDMSDLSSITLSGEDSTETVNLGGELPEIEKKEESLPIGKVFPFSNITSSQSRVVLEFLAVNDIETSEDFANYCQKINEE